jgi:GEVED domain/Secretion system C-terminal sorting domain/SprB repeat
MSNFTFNKLFLIVLSFFCFPQFSHACGYSFVGDGSSAVRIVNNSLTKDYFVCNTSYGTTFNNANLGSGLTTLSMTYGEARTWQSCQNDVREANVMYRIYTNPANRGTFQSVGLTQLTEINNPPYRVKTRFGTLTTDLLTGLLSNTTYFIEVVMQVKIDTDGNGTVDATLLNDKDLNGNTVAYVATFQTGLIAQNSGFPVTVNSTNPTCNSGTNGTAAATPTGGTAPYTYLWSNNATTASVTGLVAGNYAVTVTDALSATGIKVLAISNPTAVSATITSVSAGCGLTNGTATAVPAGGTAPYTYLWSNAATTASVASLAPTNYTLTVTDSKNCTGIATTLVSENCGGGGTYCTSTAIAPWQEWISKVKLGTIDNASAKSPYSDFTTVRTNLNTGAIYNFSMTSEFSYSTSTYGWKAWIDYNRNGLFEEPSEVVFSKTGVPPAPNAAYIITAPIIIPTTALAGATRMRVAMKLGGLPTPCETIANGEVEDYGITIINGGNTCSILANVTNITCNDNGTVANPADDTYTFSVNVTGTGTGWQTTIGATTIQGVMNTSKAFGPYSISGGDLNLTIRDIADATCTFSTVVNPPLTCSTGTATFPVTVTPTNPICNGGTNGTASATPTGGTAPYTYKWSNSTTATTASITGLGAGNYTITVTDAAAATGVKAFSITNPTAVSATITAVNAGCGLTNGTATAVLSGGTTPYTYLWSTAATTAGVSSLAPNTYTLTVTDSKNCTGTATTTVGENCGGGGTYCTSSATSPWQEWISRVKFGSIDNPSVKSPYSDFTTLRANINTGGAYNFSVTSEFSYATTVYGWKAWIDYNKNGIFEEPSEVVYSKLGAPPIPNAAYTLTSPVIIPVTALAGVTRMRVAMKLGALPTPCETIPNGEVEDYSVNIISGGGGNTCNIIAQASNIVCNDNGTATNPADDTYTFSLNVTGTGTTWQTLIGTTTITGAMNTPKSFGPYPISGGTLNFTVRDGSDATCVFSTSVDAPTPCSNGNVAPGSYCTSTGTTPWFDWIANVKLGTINNPSLKSSYSNFTNLSTVASPSASITIRITAGFGYASPSKSVNVWIDYNRNGVFDATEVAFTGTIAAPITGDTAGIAGTVTIPATATQGTTRMRVSLKAGATAPTSCETISNGEVEDYNIIIADPAVPLIGRTGSIRREVLELDAAKTPELVQIIWTTNSSRKNALFILERSADGKIFTPIYQIGAFKPTDELVDYHFEDKQAVEGANYYRLRLIYLDKSETMTKPVFVQMDTYTDFALFPNPATEGVSIDVKKWLGKAVNIDISDNSGYVVFTQKLDAQHNRLHTFDVNNLASGSYFVRLTAANQRPLVKKLMILK